MLERSTRPTGRAPELSQRARPRLRAALLLVALMVVGQTLLHLLNRGTIATSALDVNAERTVFSLASAITIAAAALGCALTRRVGEPWLTTSVLTGVLAFLSVDEFFVIHERLGVRVAALLGLSSDWDSVVWPVVYLPLVGLVFLLFLHLSRRAPREIGRLVLTGLGCLVAAVVLEVASYRFSTSETHRGLVHALEGAVEEGLELSGWGLLATATLTWALSGDRRPPGGAPDPALGRG